MPDVLLADWPVFGLRLHTTLGGTPVTLRPVRESDLAHLAAVQPDDNEHDPRPEPFPGQDVAAHRRRMIHQDYWRSMGTWTPSSWGIAFVVELDGVVVGLQAVSADDFAGVGTVDSGSWLVPGVRGRGLGVAMRAAVLALAFDGLGALAAVTTARTGNAASIGVSHRLGYRDNGLSLNASGSGLAELVHLRLTREEWDASGRGRDVEVLGVAECAGWFAAPPS